MNKYPKRPVDENDHIYHHNIQPGDAFRCGCARMHARYLTEMSRRHPVMYWGWYRWWIPSLLHEDEYKELDHWLKYYRNFEFRPYWADFALYHPVQFLVYLLLMKTMKFVAKTHIKFLTTVVKAVKLSKE
jgi:hypothetical protein